MTAWHEHEAELRGWLRDQLRSRADAEDMLQDVFLKAMRQGERFCAPVGNSRSK
jgi:RNA polymerase sigma-70 factor (ECF subfamily)